MILQPARIVLIDNEQTHLRALSDALGSLGSASLSYLYKDEHPEHCILAGVRLVFCDLHLNSDAKTSDTKMHCANIASMLATGLAEDHGPYLLVVWSQFPDEVESLRTYLDELAPGQQPFDLVCLNKSDFINVDDGSVIEGTDLPKEIKEKIAELPGLTALLSWEQTVSASAAKTTNLLWGLCKDSAGTGNPDKMLTKTLGKLAAGGAGVSNGTDAPGRSVLEALVPLLADQIEAQEINEELWKQAVDVKNRGSGASSERLYSALHIEIPTSYSADRRGVVSLLSDLVSDDTFEEFFGFGMGDLLIECGFSKKIKVKIEGRDETNTVPSDGVFEGSKWFLVQINAACDEAQSHPGLQPYCLAAIVPDEFKTGKSPRGSIETTNPFIFEEKKSTMYLMGRFVIGLSKRQTEALTPSLRLRSALLDKLVFGLRTNAARLGVTEP